MKRLLAIVTIAMGVLLVAPLAPASAASSASSACVQAQQYEIGASNIIAGGSLYTADPTTTPNRDGVLGTTVNQTSTTTYSNGHVSVHVDLQSGACNGISYSVEVRADDAAGTLLLAKTVSVPMGTTSVVFADNTPITLPEGYTADHVKLRAWTSSRSVSEIDAAPNTGWNIATDDVPGGQGWN